MASTTSKRPPHQPISFFGAANQVFTSFEEQTQDFLQTYCPSLTDVANSASYIIPPRFSYSKPHEVCDHDCCDLETKGAPAGEPPLKDRYSCDAENLVFEAISELILQGIGGPFLAGHSLDLKFVLDSSIRQQLFPSLTDGFIKSVKPCIREYDFVLIGPRIGLIVVEVKGSKYARDFADGQSQLPKRYAHGLHQLNSVDHLLSLYKECAELEIRAESIRKILFAPRLKKSRYDTWFSGLTDDQKEHIEISVVGIQQWFEEDAVDGSLFEKMRREIEDKPDFAIDGEQFRRGIWIHAALKSAIIFRNADNRREESMASVFSLDHALMDDYASIDRQCLEEALAKKSHSLKVSQHKVILLTPEQQNAVKGLERQLLIGTAGTGKSFIFMQHAIELAENKQSVLVLAMESYMETYRDVLEANGCKRYEIRSWAKEKKKMWSKIRGSHMILWELYRNSKYIVDLASEFVPRNQGDLQDVFELLSSASKFDAILIDDAFDYSNSSGLHFVKTKSMFLALAMMAFAKNSYPDKHVWVAFDVFVTVWVGNRNYRNYREAVEKLIETSSNPADYFSCTVLHRVMRNSERIFPVAFNEDVSHQLGSYYSPFPGHKLSCRPPNRILKPSSSQAATDNAIWSNVKAVLDRLTSSGVCTYGQIGILVGGLRRIESIVQFLVEQCAKFQIPAERSNWKSNYDLILNGSTEYSPSTNVGVNDKVTIDSWEQVSSREWMAVIYVEVVDLRNLQRSDNDVRTHRGYRARTRAVGELIEISIVEYYEDDHNVEICCSKEVDLYHDKDGRVRYLQSNLHTIRCKRLKADRNCVFPKRHLATLDDLIGFASYFRDDLAWDIDHYVSQLRERKGSIRLKQTANNKSGKTFLTPSYSVHDLRAIGPAIDRHPALNLDCDMYERVVEKLNLPCGDYNVALNMEDFRRQLANLWKEWDVIRAMERALRRNNEQLSEEQLDILARSLDSMWIRDEFEKCVETVIESLLLTSPIRADYLRVNLMEICKSEAKYAYRDFLDTERQIWRH